MSRGGGSAAGGRAAGKRSGSAEPLLLSGESYPIRICFFSGTFLASFLGSVTVRTPFGRATPAELPAPAPSEALTRLPPPAQDSAEVSYVLNTNSRRFHLPDCSSVAEMKSANRQDFTGTREELLAMGYQPCGRCKP